MQDDATGKAEKRECTSVLDRVTPPRGASNAPQGKAKMTKTEIWNLALGEVGSLGTIINDDDATPEAKHCAAAWTRALDAVLQSYPWACARREATLARRADLKSLRWKFVYQLPVDCLTIRETIPARIDRELSPGQLLCDEQQMAVVYTARIDAEKLAPHVADALVLKLAQHLTTALRTGGSQLIQSLYQRYELALAEARRIEGSAAFDRPRPRRWRICG